MTIKNGLKQPTRGGVVTVLMQEILPEPNTPPGVILTEQPLQDKYPMAHAHNDGLQLFEQEETMTKLPTRVNLDQTK